jgi:outer membrane cobalamin receptor
MIPASAVQRVEVLTSGASAIHGSDAVAGVANVILKDNIDDTTFRYHHATPPMAVDGRTISSCHRASRAATRI